MCIGISTALFPFYQKIHRWNAVNLLRLLFHCSDRLLYTGCLGCNCLCIFFRIFPVPSGRYLLRIRWHLHCIRYSFFSRSFCSGHLCLFCCKRFCTVNNKPPRIRFFAIPSVRDCSFRGQFLDLRRFSPPSAFSLLRYFLFSFPMQKSRCKGNSSCLFLFSTRNSCSALFCLLSCLPLSFFPFPLFRTDHCGFLSLSFCLFIRDFAFPSDGRQKRTLCDQDNTDDSQYNQDHTGTDLSKKRTK